MQHNSIRNVFAKTVIWIKLASKQERGANEAFSTYTFEDYSAFNYLQARGTASLACFSSIFLCPSSLTVVQLESELFFGGGRGVAGGGQTLSEVPHPKEDVCQTGRSGSTHGMSHYKWPLPDPLFHLQRVKAAFFWYFWHSLSSPLTVQGRARRTHPEHRRLPVAMGSLPR